MFCTKCGNPVEDNARFCTKCGQRFDDTTQMTANHVVVTPKKSGGGSKAIIILLSILIAAVLAVGGTVSYMFISRPQPAPQQGSQAPDVPDEPKVLVDGARIKDYAAAKEVLESYLEMLPVAVNTGSYSYIEPYILAGSPLHKMQVSLVDGNYGKGITERFIDYSVDHVEWVHEEKCYIYTEECYEISSGGDSVLRDYEWKYTVVEEGGRYYLTNLEAYDD